MTEEHRIAPPQELLKHWEDQYFDEDGENYDVMLIEAYQAGADAELEACCEWVSQWRCMVGGNRPEVGLRAARRPEPPSLKEKASQIVDCLIEGDCLNDDDAITLRQVVESLPS